VMREFRWQASGDLIDEDLQLVLVERIPEDAVKGYALAYKFDM